jgi:hypothetical protein
MKQEVYRSMIFGRRLWIRQDNDRSYQVSLESDRMVHLCKDFWSLEEAQTAAHEFAHSYLGGICGCAAEPIWEAVAAEPGQASSQLYWASVL